MIINGALVTGDVIQLIDTTPGKIYYFQPPKLTSAQINGMIATWGTTQRGRIWFNRDTRQLEMWKGSARVQLG